MDFPPVSRDAFGRRMESPEERQRCNFDIGPDQNSTRPGETVLIEFVSFPGPEISRERKI